MPNCEARRGVNQWIQIPFAQANVHTTLTKNMPHCPLVHVAQNQNGCDTMPTTQAHR